MKPVRLWVIAAIAAAFPIWCFGWIFDDLQPGTAGTVALKLVIVFLAGLACAGMLWDRRLKPWRMRAKHLEDFAASFPAGGTQLSEDGPEDLDNLAHALRAAASRVRTVVERANIESSRRDAILTCMAEGVLAVDSNLRVLLCNEAFAEAFNTRTSTAEGRTLYEVVREPILRDTLSGVLESGKHERARFQLPTAGSRWFEARALPLESAANGGAVIVLHDITDIQNQEQLRKDFVADVSHELRTPLAAIRGYAETLLDGALQDEENNRKFVEIILSHAIRLNNIASDLLVLSEIDAKSDHALPAERISLLEVIDSAMHSVQNAATLRDVVLSRDRCEECFVMGLRFRLEQVVSNLLDNAVKFNRPGGEVRIECGSDADHVSFSVADTGVGIPQAELKRVFERFYRVDKARARATGGTGLGLPIVKEVIERMGGTVTVESQLGKGAKFTITLPKA